MQQVLSRLSDGTRRWGLSIVVKRIGVPHEFDDRVQRCLCVSVEFSGLVNLRPEPVIGWPLLQRSDIGKTSLNCCYLRLFHRGWPWLAQAVTQGSSKATAETK